MTQNELPGFATNRDALVRHFFMKVPFNTALGIELVSTDVCRATMRLHYRDELIGNPVNGVLHGGAVTALMDAACGGAVFMALDDPQGVATLDLRVDYLRSAKPGSILIAEAECYHITRSVAFVRCSAYHEEDPHKTVASVAATFMLGTS